MKILVCLGILPLLACLAGCPSEKAGQNQAETGTGGSSATIRPSTEQQDSNDAAAEQQPTGDIWVKLEETTVAVNEPAEVEYSLVPAPNNDAWIALVPAAIESQSLRDNIKHAVDRVTLPAQAHRKIELTTRNPGIYFIRMFPAQLGEVMAIAETTVVFTDEPIDGMLEFTPPYVTITDRELPEPPKQYQGYPMIAYWEMTETPGKDAWIGMIPTSCTTLDAKSNSEAAVDIQYLNGEIQDRSIFILSELGEYVFRIFPSQDEQAQMICESQVFIATPKPSKEAKETE